MLKSSAGMIRSNTALKEPLSNLLLQRRGQILSDWQFQQTPGTTGKKAKKSSEARSRGLDARSDKKTRGKREALRQATSSFLDLCMDELEGRGAHEGSERRLALWIEETRRMGLRLPDIVESLLNLKNVLSRLVTDRLYYRPMEVKNLNQAINSIFDRTLFCLSAAFSNDAGNVDGPGGQGASPPGGDTDSINLNENLCVLSTISHELHTPLTSIIGYAEGVIENLEGYVDDRSNEVRDDVNKVLKNAHYLMDIIRNSMEWSRLEHQKDTLKPESFDLRECVLEVLTTISTMLSEKGIRAVLRSPSGIPRPFGDYSRTKQILLNLLTNAVRYTPPQGKIAIEIVPLSGNQGKGNQSEPPFIKVTVIDNGIGIDGKKIGDVFEEFAMLDGNNNGKKEGAGLGLYIAKRLVELQGGEIWSRSQHRKGSRFSFTLPTVYNNIH